MATVVMHLPVVALLWCFNHTRFLYPIPLLIVFMSHSHSQIQPTMNPVPLDNLNHNEFTASQIRLQRQHLYGGEPLSSRHTDYAASTASYYSSSNSLTGASEMHHGYLSGSQAHDDHYDSSDYRVCLMIRGCVS